MQTDQPESEIRFLRESQATFDMLKSIIHGLEQHLFPPGVIRNEASDVDIAERLLNSKDIERFLTPEFIQMMKSKLALKAKGIIKQAEIDNASLSKYGK